jgi:serine/threonine protein kinase
MNTCMDAAGTLASAGVSSAFAAGNASGRYSSAVLAAAASGDAQTSELVREMAVMKKLAHPHVVALHEVSTQWRKQQCAVCTCCGTPGIVYLTAKCMLCLLPSAAVARMQLLLLLACLSSACETSSVDLHVQFLQVIHDPDAKLLIMVMEYMPGGPLLSSVGQGMTEPLPEVAARRYFRCVCVQPP